MQTVGHQSTFETHAGNLEFYVHVVYGAQQLPRLVREKTVAIFRDLVLAKIDHYPQVVAGNRRVAEVAG